MRSPDPLTVRCPRCGAPPTRPCRTPNEELLHGGRSHTGRSNLALNIPVPVTQVRGFKADGTEIGTPQHHHTDHRVVAWAEMLLRNHPDGWCSMTTGHLNDLNRFINDGHGPVYITRTPPRNAP